MILILILSIRNRCNKSFITLRNDRFSALLALRKTRLDANAFNCNVSMLISSAENENGAPSTLVGLPGWSPAVFCATKKIVNYFNEISASGI